MDAAFRLFVVAPVSLNALTRYAGESGDVDNPDGQEACARCGVLVALGVENSMSAFDRDRKPEPKLSIGFIGRSVLPGESQEEFDRLEDDLYEEYGPEGPIEEDLVETIAKAIWRKRHMDIFCRAFTARMIWGSFFGYPGDPDGGARITQAYVERTRASMVKEITKFATAIVKRKLDEDADRSSKFGDDADKVAVSTAASAPQEDLDLKEIPSQKDAPPTVAGRTEKMLDQFHNMMAVVESTLGADVVAEIFRTTVDTITEQALAELGDLLTPEQLWRKSVLLRFWISA